MPIYVFMTLYNGDKNGPNALILYYANIFVRILQIYPSNSRNFDYMALQKVGYNMVVPSVIW